MTVFANFGERARFTLSVLFRYLPMRHPTGIFAVGSPTPDSPVVVSGNYFHTVKRILGFLEGRNCWLLVADSSGINVWCAAGVGDFNEHKIADTVNAYGVAAKVRHRTLILPQLAAVGIELGGLRAQCGFEGKWGPASYYDLPRFLDQGCVADPEMRKVSFSFRNKCEMAVGMLFAYFFSYVKYYIIFALIFGGRYNHEALFVMASMTWTIALTIFSDHFPFKWPTTSVLFSGLLGLPLIGVFVFLSPESVSRVPFYLVAHAAVAVLVAVDMLGSAVQFKSTIPVWLRTFTNRSLFQPAVDRESCTGCGSCVEVCPKGLFRVDSEGARVDHSRECSECLSCIKQCDAVAIRNLNGRRFKGDVKSIPAERLEQVGQPAADGRN